ncbi:hypothetical protein ISCGN_007378 [Ixodes scapularis]
MAPKFVQGQDGWHHAVSPVQATLVLRPSDHLILTKHDPCQIHTALRTQAALAPADASEFMVRVDKSKNLAFLLCLDSHVTQPQSHLVHHPFSPQPQSHPVHHPFSPPHQLFSTPDPHIQWAQFCWYPGSQPYRPSDPFSPTIPPEADQDHLLHSINLVWTGKLPLCDLWKKGHMIFIPKPGRLILHELGYTPLPTGPQPTPLDNTIVQHFTVAPIPRHMDRDRNATRRLLRAAYYTRKISRDPESHHVFTDAALKDTLLLHSRASLHATLPTRERSAALPRSKQNFSPLHWLLPTTLPLAVPPTSTRTQSRPAPTSLRASHSLLHFLSSTMLEDLFTSTGYLVTLALPGMNALISLPAKRSSGPLLTLVTKPLFLLLPSPP